MRTCTLLITIFSFIKLGFGSADSNLTEDYSVCPVSLFRFKRQIKEYTRWRATTNTPSEFIVKVLDEVATSVTTPGVVAVNIVPPQTLRDKIIIGGVMVPTPTRSVFTTPALPDYRRFISQSAVTDKKNVIVPGKAKDYPPHIKYELRDESPPDSPQFLPRRIAHVPIATVTFRKYPLLIKPHRTTLPPYASKPSQSTGPNVDSDEIVPVRPRIQPDLSHEEFDKGDENSLYIDTNARKFMALPQNELTKQLGKFLVASIKEQDVKNKSYYETDSLYHMQLFEDSGESDETEQGMSIQLVDQEKKQNESVSNRRLDNSFDYQDVNGEPIQEKYKEGMPIQLDDQKNKTNEYVSGLRLIDHLDHQDVTDEMIDVNGEIIYENNTSFENVSTIFENVSLVFENISLDISLISEEITRRKKAQKKANCSMTKLREVNFRKPSTLPELVAQLKQWTEDSPVAQWVDITGGNLTTMENPIYMVIVDDPSRGQVVSAKQTIVIVAGIQGHDYHAVASAMYFLYQLIEKSEFQGDLLSKYRFWVVPVFNPDGYEYSMTFSHRDHWNKNLRQYWECKGKSHCEQCATLGIQCSIKPCFGVNLDRNFEYQWIPAEELKHEQLCGDLYAGERQISEPETIALTQYLHEQRTRLFGFIALKEGDVLGVMYPYSHTKKKRAYEDVFKQRASRAAAAAFSIIGRPYVAGQTSDFLRMTGTPSQSTKHSKLFHAGFRWEGDRKRRRTLMGLKYRVMGSFIRQHRRDATAWARLLGALYAGGIEDWVDGHLGVDNTYSIMMFRDIDSHRKQLIERVAHEAYAAMDTLLMQCAKSIPTPAPDYDDSKDEVMSPYIGSGELHTGHCWVIGVGVMLMVT